MSLDRYLTIRFPLKYGRNKSRRITLIKISLIWFISICLCSPLLILGFIDESNVYDLSKKQCVLFNKSFKLYGSIFAFYIPFTLMLVTYVKTIRILKLILNKKKNGLSEAILEKSYNSKNNSNSNFSKKKSHTISIFNSNIDHKEHEQKLVEQKKKSLLHLNAIILSKKIKINKIIEKHKYLSISFRNLNYQFEFSSIQDFKTILNLDKSVLSNIYSHIKRKPKSSSLCIEFTNKLDSNDFKKLYNLNHNSTYKIFKPVFVTKNHQLPFYGDHKIKKVAYNERKALKVLIIMFTVFATLWSPFFILNTLSAIFVDISETIFSKYETHVYSILTWLGYVSSMANPIVYTMFNKTFRKVFFSILKCN